MIAPVSEKEAKNIKLARTLGLAGELRRLIVRCLEVVPLPVKFGESVCGDAADYTCPAIFGALADGLKREVLAAKTVRTGGEVPGATQDRASADMTAARERWDRLRQSAQDLKQGQALWEELEALLVSWPETVTGPGLLLLEAQVEWDQYRDQLKDAASALKESRSVIREVDQKYKELVCQAEGLIDRNEEYEDKVSRFSRQVDVRTADLKRGSVDARRQMEKAASEIKAVYQERSLLLRRQAFLSDRLTRLADIRQKAVEELEGLQRNHENLAARAVASVRARAVQRGALIRRSKSLHGQLHEAYRELLTLIGRSPALETALRLVESRLDGIRQDLDQVKTHLARAYHDFIQAQTDEDTTLPAPAAPPEALLKKLQSLSLGEQVTARLPRQLSSYRAALIRDHRIDHLQKNEARQELTLERLQEKNGRLLQALAAGKSRVADLVREKSQLISELAGAGETESDPSGMKDDIHQLLSTLGLALYRSQAGSAEMEKQRAEAENRAAELAALAEQLEEKTRQGAAQGMQQKETIRLLSQEKQRVEQQLAALRCDYVAMVKEKDQAVRSFLNFGTAVTLESAVRDHQHGLEKENLASQLDSAHGIIRDLETKIREMEANYRIEAVAHKKSIADLNVKAAQLASGQQHAQDKALELSQSVSRLEAEASDRQNQYQVERNKLFTLGKAWKKKAQRLQDQLDTLENRFQQSQGVVQQQDQTLRIQKAQEAELIQLLTFFMEQMDTWARPAQASPAVPLPEGAEGLALMIHLLHQENDDLQESVQVLKEDRRLLTLENEHLFKSHQAMKNRLTQLLPVFDFFFRSWFSTTAALTAGHADRTRAIRDLHRIKHQTRIQGARLLKLSSRLEDAEKDLEQAREHIGRIDDEKTEALHLEARFRTLYEQTRSEVDRLTQLRARMAKTIGRQQASLANLTESRETLLLENQTRDQERKHWQAQSEILSQHARSLSRDLDDRKGQVESAWAAVAWLGSRAKETLANLQSELTAQAETIHALESRLGDKSEQIKALEQAQDRLGLLFWLLFQSGGRNGQLADALRDLADEQDFQDAAALAGNRLKILTAATLKNLRDDRFQQAARKAVRRGFYSLLLACGMVMAAPENSSRATVYCPAPGPGRIVTGMIESLPCPLPPLASGPVYSPYLDRECDIGFIDLPDRSKGEDHIQALIRSRVDDLAWETGLKQERFVQLVQRFFDPDQVVSMDRLQQKGLTVEKVKKHYPSIFKDFNSNVPQRSDFDELVHLADLVNILECRVWDRLYQDFRILGAGPQKALAMLLGNARLALENRKQLRQVEFAGKLRPIEEMEQFGLEDFMKVVTPYIKAHIKAIVARPAYAHAHRPEEIDEYARRLACDMYVAGKTFGVPRTIMVAIAHQETYFANILGDQSLSASPFQIYQPTKPYIIRTMAQKGLMVPAVPDHLQDHITLATFMATFFMSSLIDKHSHQWQKDRPPICDLDRVARSYNGGPSYPGKVYQKKMALMGYLDRYHKTDMNQNKDKPQG